MTKLQKQVLELSGEERLILLHLLEVSLSRGQGNEDDLTPDEEAIENQAFKEYEENPESGTSLQAFRAKYGA